MKLERFSVRTSRSRGFSEQIYTLARPHAQLEEPITADAEGQPWLVEGLDDGEIEQREFKLPADTESDPEKERERAIFDLVMVERCSEDVVSRMYWIPRGEVRQIAERVREKIRREAASVSQRSSKQRSDRQPAEKKAS